ncbi:class I SAM-dependent methyltransferase [Roseateles sp. MS654]|uniref:class I SAM-dependent methyltransferase n=1 Tax=Roseateles sp. MS654 TaxID=3412685 RepID=UPI003C2B81A0
MNTMPDLQTRLRETQAAFDSVAADYDGPRGNNAAIQDMRAEMWRWLDATFAPGSRLIDLGCGTGLDAVHLAESGHRVLATDWSPRMVERTQERAGLAGVAGRVRAMAVGAHELHRLSGRELDAWPADRAGETSEGAVAGGFDGAYSNLGPLNCVPDLRAVSRECARLLRPGGALVFTVIGRHCPWEVLHYARQRRWDRATIRYARGTVPVGMNRQTIWTRYFTPGEFHRDFAAEFELVHVRGICVFAPPPYLVDFKQRHAAWHDRLWRLDRRVAGWPGLRQLGDHFLVVMRKRAVTGAA